MDGVTQRRVALGGIEVTIPDVWDDITNEVEADDPLYTLADPADGVGALQFSPAIYQGGVAPNPSLDDLCEMALNFGEERDLGEPFEERRFTHGCLRGAGASFRWEDDFIRVWYVSDGWSFAFITYVCEWSGQSSEISTCEDIVKSLRFGQC